MATFQLNPPTPTNATPHPLSTPMTYGWILSFRAYCVIVGHHVLSVQADMVDTLNTERACLQRAEAVFDSVALSVSHSNRQPNNPLAV